MRRIAGEALCWGVTSEAGVKARFADECSVIKVLAGGAGIVAELVREVEDVEGTEAVKIGSGPN